ncbi:c-type cytochrome [Polymorphum gilvum]|uniref:Cytochrome c family protein n=1 Tax=Polymorphum gilvum (strain LMG 25793 / CGMCC 1.9160 / SL003B-26A1) TaxID=991905 RepID=F2J060_POLGS|nr:cytochrome c [Polymorphum gilvum]ADZ71895.1 Cytochrome c family protein [Polymorphum gilvum SL003B-26A1]
MMPKPQPSVRILAAAVVIGVAGAGAYGWLGRAGDVPIPPKVSALRTDTTGTGQAAFDTYCAECHGTKGTGTANGPPLVHKIYEPSHHADGTFVLAVRRGVRAHHWGFGDMPPVEDVGDGEIAAIIDFIRAEQRRNGIF